MTTSLDKDEHKYFLLISFKCLLLNMSEGRTYRLQPCVSQGMSCLHTLETAYK